MTPVASHSPYPLPATHYNYRCLSISVMLTSFLLFIVIYFWSPRLAHVFVSFVSFHDPHHATTTTITTPQTTLQLQHQQQHTPRLSCNVDLLRLPDFVVHLRKRANRAPRVQSHRRSQPQRWHHPGSWPTPRSCAKSSWSWWTPSAPTSRWVKANTDKLTTAIVDAPALFLLIYCYFSFSYTLAEGILNMSRRLLCSLKGLELSCKIYKFSFRMNRRVELAMSICLSV